MKASFTREQLIPKDAVEVIKNDIVEVHTYMLVDRPIAIGFRGKAHKPSFHGRFTSVEARADYIKAFIDKTTVTTMVREAHKKVRRIERSTPHTLKVGDINYTSWGYDQTNVNFYQVTKIIGKNTVEVREIASKCVEDHGSTTYVMPVKDAFFTPRFEGDTWKIKPMIKRVGAGNTYRIESYATAWPWDGKPQYETGAGWGH